jgi:hypothetical protein
MATNESTVGRSVKMGLDIVIGLVVLALIIYVALPFVKVPVLGDVLKPEQTIKVQPTRTINIPIRTGGDTNSAAPAIPGVAQNAATAQALYDAAVQAGEQAAPVPNVGQGAPVEIISKPAERQPAGDNVPTAEPVQQAESGGMFGSKPALINPQADHQCKHGQAWTEKGCKNP